MTDTRTATLDELKAMSERGESKPPAEDAPEREMPDGFWNDAEKTLMGELSDLGLIKASLRRIEAQNRTLIEGFKLIAKTLSLEAEARGRRAGRQLADAGIQPYNPKPKPKPEPEAPIAAARRIELTAERLFREYEIAKWGNANPLSGEDGNERRGWLAVAKAAAELFEERSADYFEHLRAAQKRRERKILTGGTAGTDE